MKNKIRILHIDDNLHDSQIVKDPLQIEQDEFEIIDISSVLFPDNDGNPRSSKVIREITEHKQVEKSLQESEKLYRNLFESMLNGFAYCKMLFDHKKPLDFIYLKVNKAFESLTGLSNVIGKKVSEVIPGIQESDPELFKIYGRVALTGKPETCEIYVKTLKSWYLISVYSPQKEYFVAIFDVITKRKQSEELLVASEIRYRQLFESAKDGILILDAESGMIVDINPYLVELLGYSAEQFHGKKIWEIGIFSDLIANHSKFLELQQKEYVRYDDLPLKTSDGRQIAVEFVSNVYEVNHRKVIQCNIRNITERKNIENALKESDVKFRFLMENSADAIFITDPMGKYIYTNKAVTDLLGYSSEEMLCKTIADLAPADKIESYFEILSAIMSKGKVFAEIELKKKDGHFISTDLNSVLLPNGSVYGSCRDITVRKQAEAEIRSLNANLELKVEERTKKLEELNTLLEEKVKERTLQLNDAKERAEASDRLKTAFMNNISHELRTPLSGILGFASLIIKPDITDEKKNYFLEILNNSGKRLLNTIDEYMDISLIVSGNQVVKMETCFLTHMLKEVFDKCKSSCEQKGITLIIDIPPSVDDFQINTDKTILLKIINHLIDNALKFTKEGRIIIGFSLKENIVEFFIKDTGKGISTEAQQYIYGYFVQEDMTHTRSFEGSGLGLSISKGLVKLLEGEIWFESEKGIGSTFYFTIPFGKPIYKAQNSIVMENEFKVQAKPVILIAEDDDTNYAYLEEVFSSTSIELIRAVNGAEAVEIYRNNFTITLILMDLKMPVLNGFEATRQIKVINKNIPIVAITAYAFTDDETKARDAGCDDYISKPLNLKNMEAIINKYLVGTKLQQAN